MAEERRGGVDANLARHGKIAYVQIPAANPQETAEFYADLFGWEVRGRPEQVHFTDGSGDLIGAFVPDRAAREGTGPLLYVYVTDLDAVLERIVDRGGEVIRPVYPDADLRIATFRDPAGNEMGIWEGTG